MISQWQIRLVLYFVTLIKMISIESVPKVVFVQSFRYVLLFDSFDQCLK